MIVGLGTNGPITAADFDSMMAILNGATSPVVFVNTHVDRPWQDPNRYTILASGALSTPTSWLPMRALAGGEEPTVDEDASTALERDGGAGGDERSRTDDLGLWVERRPGGCPPILLRAAVRHRGYKDSNDGISSFHTSVASWGGAGSLLRWLCSPPSIRMPCRQLRA